MGVTSEAGSFGLDNGVNLFLDDIGLFGPWGSSSSGIPGFHGSDEGGELGLRRCYVIG